RGCYVRTQMYTSLKFRKKPDVFFFFFFLFFYHQVPEDLCILYSNRAACYLKDGNSQDCIQDCTRALELQPFSLKPLLRRALAYESLERYRKAYVDYKTVLQIDISVQAAHDSVNRITKLLIEQDGPEWREKLPEIPLVPLSAQQHRREERENIKNSPVSKSRRTEVLFTSLKQEGNDYVKKSQYQEAVGKYSECLKLKPEECAIYTNRALCYVKLERFAEAKQDCDAALKLEPTNKKAFYRRAMANKGLKVRGAGHKQRGLSGRDENCLKFAILPGNPISNHFQVCDVLFVNV
uniref:Sperm associated antigen 1 n=1 Tax=Myripristis murdjan TaxID=586833 RepID=A0A667ZIV8_9TELE